VTAPTQRSGRSARPQQAGETLPPDPLWYKDAVIYEVPVRAFFDSDGNGTGDFRGLTQKLAYLRDLGITAIWVLPFYPSPGRDDGYDIVDYVNANSDYGTAADVRAFIDEAHRNGLRVIIELVCNHTSDQHPWFQRARRAAAGSAARDFYVWSDTPDRYGDARIIFSDFETSNWTWDPVAGAYYWHRFYSHQPDLNFANARVRQAVLRVVDHWLNLGVDGLCLDAVPYLYEREGTNCENLPETHAFLKALRTHVDERYADRMLLAGANQWPDDAAPYFGDGGECQMVFHFPLMSRLFMGLRMEDRFPIVDVLAQTPAIPDTSQWALFLRNHDELTLEMVTDEERDYMYRVYAGDPQTRINLGIRRRLAPLLGNSRRRIELMNGLLFSLPGTPVIYYGDEIGMGDNVYLGDRNGVRTPMQWSADRNAGFSAANRQRLFMPVITDPEYHYEAVNVDAQLANPYSLLWWMRRLIALRKRYQAFGRGTFEFLSPDNRKILAFIREYEGETLLVVANLSRYSQWALLDLSRFEGRVPVELFGSVEFPRIGREPWLTSLGPHAFLWFRLASDPTSAAIAAAEVTELPELAWGGEMQSLLTTGRSAEIATLLLSWIRGHRWFKGKARRQRAVELRDAIPVIDGGKRGVVALLQVTYTDGEPDLYVIPLVARDEREVERLLGESPQAAIARLVGPGLPPAILLDGTLVPDFSEALLDLIAGHRRWPGRRGKLVGVPSRAYRALRGPASERLVAIPLRGEQSNSSAVLGDRFILKLYRALERGPNPDLEVSRFLTKHAFTHIPQVAGAIEYESSGTESSAVAMVQEFVPNGGDLWKLTRDAVATFIEQAQAETAPPETDAAVASLMARSTETPPPLARRLLGAYAETARLLGIRTGELHLALAADAKDPAFSPEPTSPFRQRALYQAIRSLAGESLRLLAARRDDLPEHLQPEADRVLRLGAHIDARLRPLMEHHVGGMQIRIHGDYHLGQVLHTGRDIAIIDFEGEPARPLGERRLKRPALTDVAGMIRSFHYAAFAGLLEGVGPIEETGTGPLHEWARFWYCWAATTFLRGYREVTAGAPFLPSDDRGTAVLLEALLLAKASYELRYELNSRPDWVGIPLTGIAELLGG
jgi:maltose alpha-D-glucosyltransferase/alpha-amylase